MYDFRSLNDKEFEAFAIDLLSVVESRRYERFKPGKDQGVDGRWFVPSGREEIVQCKHFISSGFPALLRHIERTELPKIERLKPSRYVLITSLPLSRANKARLAMVLATFVRSESDIMGQEDLNDLLARHPEVEKRHYKLWLASSTVLRTLFNAAIEGRSRSELEQIRDEASKYVITSDYARARDHVREHQIIMITGEPGIGKTTLARQVVLDHIASEYELVVIEESVSEAEAVYVENGKQIFYFDDFLGRTYLEALKAKQDSHIVTFVKRVARDPTKRLVLTSRTNILNQGHSLTDLFSTNALEKNRYEIRVGNLSRMDKAHILYSHMWHTDLGQEFLDEIYRDRRYRQVIAHPSYNPRLIAFVLDADKVSGRFPDGYWDYIIATLTNPQDVWGYFFDNQMGQDARDLVFLTVLNGGRVLEDQLRDAFFGLHTRSEANLGLLDHRFRKASRHCVGSILDRALLDRGRTMYSLFNPSVADFAQRRLAATDLWEYYYSTLRTSGALRAIEQMRKEPFFGEEPFTRVIVSLAERERSREGLPDDYSLHLARIISSLGHLRERYKSLVTTWFQAPNTDVIDRHPDEYIALFNQASEFIGHEMFAELAERLPELLVDALLPMDEPELLKGMLRALESARQDQAAGALRQRIIEDWSYQVADVVRAEDVLADYYEPHEAFVATDALNDAITDWLWQSGVDLSEDELERLAGEIDVESVMEMNRERSNHESDEDSGFRGGGTSAMDEVDDLFDQSSRS